MPKSFAELYSRLKYGLKDIEEDKREEQYKKICETFFNPHNSKRLRKTRRIYSLEVEGQANYIIKRKNNTYQAMKNKDIVPITTVYNKKIILISYYSKNVIPIDINSLLNILKYEDISKKIYELPILNIDNEAKKYIYEMKYYLDTKPRTTVKVILIKNAFKDINFDAMTEYNKNNIEFKRMLDLYFNSKNHPLNKYLGSMRDGKATLLGNNKKYLILRFVRDCKGSNVILENI